MTWRGAAYPDDEQRYEKEEPHFRISPCRVVRYAVLSVQFVRVAVALLLLLSGRRPARLDAVHVREAGIGTIAGGSAGSDGRRGVVSVHVPLGLFVVREWPYCRVATRVASVFLPRIHTVRNLLLIHVSLRWRAQLVCAGKRVARLVLAVVLGLALLDVHAVIVPGANILADDFDLGDALDAVLDVCGEGIPGFEEWDGRFGGAAAGAVAAAEKGALAEDFPARSNVDADREKDDDPVLGQSSCSLASMLASGGRCSPHGYVEKGKSQPFVLRCYPTPELKASEGMHGIALTRQTHSGASVNIRMHRGQIHD